MCAWHTVSKAMFYGWKQKYGGLEVSGAGRLRSLKEENGRLKRLVADQMVQLQILKEVSAKSGRPGAEKAGDPKRCGTARGNVRGGAASGARRCTARTRR